MEVSQRYEEKNLDFVCIPDLGRKINFYRDAKAAIAVRREAKIFGPDIVSLHSSKAGAVGRIGLIGTGTPVIYTPHCWAFVDGFPGAGIYRWLEKCLGLLSSRIITVCEDERQFGLKHGVGNEEQVITIHNGVRDQFEKGRRELRGVDDPVRIVMVGRFEEQKNQAMLIRALAQLVDLPWRLTLVGEGPFLDDCVELAKSHRIDSRIQFAGYSSNVNEILCKHDLFALISKWEGFPRSILEAMSAEMPVIASDVGGNREAVANGVTGYIVSPDDPQELIQALSKMITHPELLLEMGQAGRQQFLKKFTFESMYASYTRMYDRLIEERTNSSGEDQTQDAALNESGRFLGT
tara:strand:- start:433 stop:1482 length:1050 start_codon:yes stop_codon:yes gene_type:complete